MQKNKQLIAIIGASLIFGCLGRSQIPDDPELSNLLTPPEGRSLEEYARHAEVYTNFLNEERIKKLRAFVAKVGANGPALTVNDFAAADAALKLLSVTKTPGMVEAAIPFMGISQYSLDKTAAEVMAATGSEAAVEHLEAAFQRNMKMWLSGDPWKVADIWYNVRWFAINGTPKARAAYDRSLKQIAEAVKTGNAEDRKWERESIANLWEKVEKEKAGKGLPDPGDARRIGPPVPREQPNRDALGNSASKPNAPAPVAAVGNANEFVPIPGGWALWAGIAALLAAAAGWLFLRRRGSRRGSFEGTKD